MKPGSLQLKKEILAAGLLKQETIIHDFKERIKQLMTTDGNVNEEEYDSNVQSQKAEAVTEVSLLSDQLEFANQEMDDLMRLEWDLGNSHSVVAFGTVVVTDNGTFFVSASLELFYIDNNPIFGISVLSPLYKSMKGKRVGEAFKYGDQHYVIKEIY